jgi:hypothetical protein
LEQILKTLDFLINQGISIKKGMNKVKYIQELARGSIDYDRQKIERWEERVARILYNNFGTEEEIKFSRVSVKRVRNDWYGNNCRELNAKIAFLKTLKVDIEKNPEFWEGFLSKNKTIQKAVSQPGIISSMNIVRKICSQFHIVAKQLGDYRHENRNTITITDEYDVQDLLHALLKIFFNDIRPEEDTPSYAGGSSRIDFLIKSEKIAIETKKTRKGLKGKEIADQLIIDIDRYKAAHPDCETLFCFVYDPENLIQNPIGFEKDINEKHKGEAEVLICPKGL